MSLIIVQSGLNNMNISFSKQKIVIYIVLAVVTFAVYWQVHQFDFINFDDNTYVAENSHVQSGITLGGFCWAFSTTSIKQTGLWNPLVWLSFMLDYQLYGLNSSGYHITNLILHILSTLLLFRLFCRMTGAVWKSAFVAALFALHPLHVESVAWVSERKDVLSAFFWMLTLCIYVYYTEKPTIKRYLLVLFSFILALMSKPMVITLPVIMILLDYWPLKRFESKRENLFLWQLKEKIPFFILSSILVIVTLYNPNTPYIPDTPDLRQFPLSYRLANAPVAFVTSLGKTFWPHNLAIFYPFPSQIQQWQIMGSSLLILGVTALVFVLAKRMPHLFVGWFLFAITIVPVIGIIQISVSTPYSIADRYHYLPSIGIATMLAWGIPFLFPSENIRRTFLFPTAIILLAFFTFLTWEQCGYWKNSIELFNHTLRVTKDNYLAHNNLGQALAKEGKNNAALYHYNKAIHFNPYRALPYYNRGTLYGQAGQYQLAIDDFNKTISLRPDYIKAYNNRGIVNIKLGLYQKGLDDLSESISLNPEYADAWNNRALIYFIQDDNISGCHDARKACELGNCSTLQEAAGKDLCR